MGSYKPVNVIYLRELKKPKFPWALPLAAIAMCVGTVWLSSLGVYSAVRAAYFTQAPRDSVEFSIGEVVRDGPLYEVLDPVMDTSNTGPFLFKPVHFRDHRGKWILMVFAPLDDGEDNYKQGQEQLARYMLALKEQVHRAVPNTELWLVRMNRMPQLGTMLGGLRETWSHDGTNLGFDRFIYAAYHRGGPDGYYVKPQLDWLSFEVTRVGLKPERAEFGPLVLGLDPEGHLMSVMHDGLLWNGSARAVATALAAAAIKTEQH